MKQRKIKGWVCKQCGILFTPKDNKPSHHKLNPPRFCSLVCFNRFQTSDIPEWIREGGIKRQNPEYIWDYYLRIKRAVFGHYSGGKIVCACCGEKEMAFLTLDHKSGGGSKHRKKIGKRGVSFYLWLRNHHYPVGFQVLCYNCNLARAMTPKKLCPHTITLLPPKPKNNTDRKNCRYCGRKLEAYDEPSRCSNREKCKKPKTKKKK